MVFGRVGNFLYRAGWVISGLLLFDFPPTIFAYSGFVSRLTNIDEAVEIGFLCTAIACLSWLAGRAMAYAIAHISQVKAVRVRKLQRLPSDRYTAFVDQTADAAYFRLVQSCCALPRCADGRYPVRMSPHPTLIGLQPSSSERNGAPEGVSSGANPPERAAPAYCKFAASEDGTRHDRHRILDAFGRHQLLGRVDLVAHEPCGSLDSPRTSQDPRTTTGVGEMDCSRALRGH